MLGEPLCNSPSQLIFPEGLSCFLPSIRSSVRLWFWSRQSHGHQCYLSVHQHQNPAPGSATCYMEPQPHLAVGQYQCQAPVLYQQLQRPDRPFIRLTPLPSLPQLGGKSCGDATPSFSGLISSHTMPATMQDAYTSLQHRHLVIKCTGNAHLPTSPQQSVPSQKNLCSHVGGPQNTVLLIRGGMLLGPTERLCKAPFSLRLGNVTDLVTK